MKITEIYIRNYLQFRDFHLNLTYPDTGEPLDKVCFIGANGTGKSTLLRIISNFLINIENFAGKDDIVTKINILKKWLPDFSENTLIYFRIKSKYIYVLFTWDRIFCCSDQELDEKALEKIHDLNCDLKELENSVLKNFRYISSPKPKFESRRTLLQQILLEPDSQDIVSYAQSDRVSLLQAKNTKNKNNNINLPQIDLNQALKLFNSFPIYHDVSCSNVDDFWQVLIYQIKNREGDYLKFLKAPENKKLRLGEVEEKFNQENPEILEKLAEQWNLILDRTGLEFDVENVKVPVQLTENLEAYIRLKNSKKNIPYNNLSTGIRNFIFQLGHIYALYFNRDIKRGFLLIDEPESSLFPDLLYDLIDRYLAIIQNTQFFVATHSPIIAAQFEPAERFILEFDDDGYVNARLGVSPEGDDPNDLLVNDFVVRSLYGKKGIEQWERYLYLRRKIVETEDKEEKKELLREYSKIGNAYNFLPNEISE